MSSATASTAGSSHARSPRAPLPRVIRRLAAGETVDHDGKFFSLRKANILPVPEPSVPLVVGGSGDVAVRRTAAYGDGWLGIFCSARRFADTVSRIRTATSEAGRPAPTWFGLNMWCGLGGGSRDLLDRRLEALYNLPAEKFEHVTAAGSPEAVAAKLTPYVEAGAEHLTLIVAADSIHQGIDDAAEVRRLLQDDRAT